MRKTKPFGKIAWRGGKKSCKEIEASVRNCTLQKKSIKDGFKANSDTVKNAAIRSLGLQTENRSKLADTQKEAQTNLQSVIGKKPKEI